MDIGRYLDQQGEPLGFAHVVIGQIPLLPRDDVEVEALRHHARIRGAKVSAASGKAYLSMRSEAFRKLRQGIGRGIRRHNDSVTIWFADPRFPRSRRMQEICGVAHPRYEQFAQAIPLRFRDGVSGSPWEDGAMVTADGKLVYPEKQRRKSLLLA